jgi:uncharacterized alkaline shock family protein YloU
MTQQEQRATATRETERTAPDRRGIAQATATGTTRIAEAVVAKIAGLAARDIPGVFSMGSGLERRVGQLRNIVSTSGTATASQGVTVEVHESDCRVDLDLVTWYGQSIADISDTVRRNVIGQIEGMTGLRVSEVNIQVNDIHVDGDQAQPADDQR